MADTSITRTLALAARTLGGLERLADHLGVGEQALREWLEGHRVPPTGVYVRALDIVAGGPFVGPKAQRVRAKKKSA